MSLSPAPAVLITSARLTIGEKAVLWGASWPRASAFLARQGLESAVGLLWTGDLATMNDASFADQLVCLPLFLGDVELARDVRYTWKALSAACHAHSYELAPTLGELEGWIDTVEQLITRIAAKLNQSPRSLLGDL